MKSFKEYMTKGFAIGGIDAVHPMVSVGDKPPKGKGSRSSRAVGLVAHSVGQSFGSLKPTASIEGTPLHKHMVKKGVIKKKKD